MRHTRVGSSMFAGTDERSDRSGKSAFGPDRERLGDPHESPLVDFQDRPKRIGYRGVIDDSHMVCDPNGVRKPPQREVISREDLVFRNGVQSGADTVFDATRRSAPRPRGTARLAYRCPRRSARPRRTSSAARHPVAESGGSVLGGGRRRLVLRRHELAVAVRPHAEGLPGFRTRSGRVNRPAGRERRGDRARGAFLRQGGEPKRLFAESFGTGFHCHSIPRERRTSRGILLPCLAYFASALCAAARRAMGTR